MRRRAPRASLAAAIFNVAPLVHLVRAVRLKWRSSPQAYRFKFFAMSSRIWEVVFEAFPQSILQLYVVARQNQLDTLLIVSIVTSVMSVVCGMLHWVLGYAIMHKKGAISVPIARRTVLFNLIFLPWIFLHFVAFIMPLTFFASTKTNPIISVVALYFPAHVVLLALGPSASEDDTIHFFTSIYSTNIQ